MMLSRTAFFLNFCFFLCFTSCKNNCNEFKDVQSKFFDVLIEVSIRDTLKSNKRWKHMKCVLLDESLVEYGQSNMGRPTYYDCFRRESYGLNVSKQNVNIYKDTSNVMVGYYLYFDYINLFHSRYYDKVGDWLYLSKDSSVQVIDLSNYYDVPKCIWNDLSKMDDFKREVLAKGNYDYVREIDNEQDFDNILNKFKMGKTKEDVSLDYNNKFRYFYDEEYEQILKISKKGNLVIEVILPAKLSCFNCKYF